MKVTFSVALYHKVRKVQYGKLWSTNLDILSPEEVRNFEEMRRYHIDGSQKGHVQYYLEEMEDSLVLK